MELDVLDRPLLPGLFVNSLVDAPESAASHRDRLEFVVVANVCELGTHDVGLLNAGFLLPDFFELIFHLTF